MSGDIPGLPELTDRIRVLERSLRATRVGLCAVLLFGVVLLASAWRPGNTVAAERVILTDDIGTQIMVLRAVDGFEVPALIMETPGGKQVMVLGPAARPVR